MGNNLKIKQTNFIYLYLAKSWFGKTLESKEMTVEWHDKFNIRLNEMWGGDKNWFNTATGERKSLIHLYFQTESDEPKKVVIDFVNELYENIHKKITIKT